MYTSQIQQLIRAFKKLPGVGSRTAERYVFFLLKSGKKDVAELTLALKEVINTIKTCETCCNFSDSSPCKICTNPKRSQTQICVVTHPQDVEVIERVGIHKGLYHVLRDTLNTEKTIQEQTIKITELFERIKHKPTELILALNPDMAGETTMMYISRFCKKNYPETKVTRLARGLPMGSDVQYADNVTLESAFINRT
tara:strand:- start:263 stop:853 length:591 start_codon:yes stop_codon:yes gene_type:complete